MTTKNSVFEGFRPDNSALLLIDHQIGTMQLIKTQPLAHVKQLTIALAKAAAVLRMPVVLTSSQETLFQGPLLPELKGYCPKPLRRGSNERVSSMPGLTQTSSGRSRPRGGKI